VGVCFLSIRVSLRWIGQTRVGDSKPGRGLVPNCRGAFGVWDRPGVLAEGVGCSGRVADLGEQGGFAVVLDPDPTFVDGIFTAASKCRATKTSPMSSTVPPADVARRLVHVDTQEVIR